MKHIQTKFRGFINESVNKGFYNFNRHEVFNADDLDTVSDVRNALFRGEFEDSDPKVVFEVTNQINGLFDGYLYEDLLNNIGQIEGLDIKLLNKLALLVQKIEKHIEDNGETHTQIA